MFISESDLRNSHCLETLLLYVLLCQCLFVGVEPWGGSVYLEYRENPGLCQRASGGKSTGTIVERAIYRDITGNVL